MLEYKTKENNFLIYSTIFTKKIQLWIILYNNSVKKLHSLNKKLHKRKVKFKKCILEDRQIKDKNKK